jgi:hypothetical protein
MNNTSKKMNNNAKLFVLKANGWEDIFVKNKCLDNKDTFDKAIAEILAVQPTYNTILLPPITKAERYKIHRFQRKNKMVAETIRTGNTGNTGENQNMLVTVPTSYLKEFLLKWIPEVPEKSPKNELEEKIDSLFNDFKLKVKDLLSK